MNHQANHHVYPRQFFLLAFISGVCFKVVMLPQYLVTTAGRQAWMTMALMMTIELMMLGVVYGFVRETALTDNLLPKPLRGALCLVVLACSMFKSSILLSESVNYVCTTLFDNAMWIYGVLGILPCIYYLAYKGGNILARTCEILFWFMAAALLFNVLFAHAEGSLANLLPIEPSTDVVLAGDKHIIWFADFTPLLLLRVVPGEKHTKLFGTLSVVALIVCPMLVILAFQAIYGGGGALVSNAFSKLAIFNKISFLLGTVDFPTVCAWLMMACVKLGLMLYAATQCLHFFLPKHRPLCAAIVAIGLGGIAIFGTRSIGNTYRIATSALRYVFGIAEYLVPMIAYTAMRICKARRTPAPALFPTLQALPEHAATQEESA